MPLSHDVALARRRIAAFPSACVVCGTSSPDASVRARDSEFSILPLFAPILSLIPGSTKVSAPACRDCARDFKQRSRLRSTLELLGFALVAGVVIWQRDVLLPEDRLLAKLAILGYAMLVIVPAAAVQVLRPPSFGISVSKRAIRYEFRERGYAEAFAELNDARVE